jgi:hypothetical protein
MNQEDRYLRDLLTGKEPEKKIFVSMNNETKKPKGNIESELTKIMSEVRMPWFCSECKKVMKSSLDDKMWKLFGHCFDCQQQLEHELRTTGKYELWEKKKYYQNRRSAILDQVDSIKNWLDNGDLEIVEPVNVDSGFVHIDKHKVPEQMKEEARDALENLDNTLSNVDKILEELEIELNV